MVPSTNASGATLGEGRHRQHDRPAWRGPFWNARARRAFAREPASPAFKGEVVMAHSISVPVLALGSALSLALAGVVAAQDRSADFIDNDGVAVGTVSVSEGPNGLILQVAVSEGALDSGWHGLHIHENADCSDHEAFQAAGGHLNPDGVEHGFLNPNGPHP